jgi:hypothetical protein
VLVAEQVDDLPLGLVPPLKAHHARRTHGASSPLLKPTGVSLGAVKFHSNDAGRRRQSRRAVKPVKLDRLWRT